MNGAQWLIEGELMRYLSAGGPIAWFQLVLLVLVFQRLVTRGLKHLASQDTCQVWHDLYLQALVQVCFALGLLLTFSGLYGYLGAGSEGRQLDLLKALGSSAIGYSAAVLGALAGLFDVVTPARRPNSPGEQFMSGEQFAPGEPSAVNAYRPIHVESRDWTGKEPGDHVSTIFVDVAGGRNRSVGRAVDDSNAAQQPAADGRGGDPFGGGCADAAAGSRAVVAMDDDILDWLGQPPDDEHADGTDFDEDA